MSAPAKHVEESWQAAEFFANKVLMEHRGTPHAAWVRALKDVLMALRCVRMHPMVLGYPMSPTLLIRRLGMLACVCALNGALMLMRSLHTSVPAPYPTLQEVPHG